MAKKTETEVSKEITLKLDEAVELAKNDLNTELQISNKVIENIKEQYGGLTIAGVQDLATYKVVKKGCSDLTTLRNGIDNYRKELTRPALEYRDKLKGFADNYIDQIKPIESRLKQQLKGFEDLVEAEKKRVFTERKNKLIKNGYELLNGMFVCGIITVDASKLSELDDDEFNVYLEKGKEELKRKEAADIRRKEEEKRREEEKKRLKEENEALRKQMEEMKAQQKALEETYKEAVGKRKEEPKKEEANHTKKEEPETKKQETAKKLFESKDEQRIYSPEFVEGFNFATKKAIHYISNEKNLRRSGIIEHLKMMKP